MSRSQAPRILVIGELNVDIVAAGVRQLPERGAEVLAEDCELTIGSASAIFAAGIAKLGCAVTFVSQVGQDSFGDFCVAALKDAGISTRHVRRKAEEKTGVTIALSNPRDRALVTFPGAIASFSAKDCDLSLMKRHHHLHLTSYYLQRELKPSFPALFREAKAAGLTTSFDPNSDPSQKWSRSINSVLKYTDVLFVNEREAKSLTRRKNKREALKALGQLVPCAVVKQGPAGAVATQNDEVISSSGFQVKTVDTTGAGDSFAAGFVSAYVRRVPLAECLRIANACGALSTLALGGTPGQPTQEELQRFLKANA
ncbi:MAG TPA: carbohydrate kinase family protein [Pyrinomonadaceae bacterium]|nr:carbohydrate kinase family protein [Pyrinomonadaceae bacterium]